MINWLNTNKIWLFISSCFVLLQIYTYVQYKRVNDKYKWHHLKYHELKKYIEYQKKYPTGTSIETIIESEPDYVKDHVWCQHDANTLCVEPVLSEWDYVHYCGFTFLFEEGKLVDMYSNSPCH